MQSQLCRYQISSTHLSVLTRLYGLIIKNAGLLRMHAQNQWEVGSMAVETLLQKKP